MDRKLGGLIAAALCLAGCASGGPGKYAGWEQVRIENAVPSADCVFKAQQTCSYPAGKCFTWYKQRATLYGANTVILSNQSQSQSTIISGASNPTGGYVAGDSRTINTSLGDYYACPNR